MLLLRELTQARMILHTTGGATALMTSMTSSSSSVTGSLNVNTGTITAKAAPTPAVKRSVSY
jgi:hypothetical protein